MAAMMNVSSKSFVFDDDIAMVLGDFGKICQTHEKLKEDYSELKNKEKLLVTDLEKARKSITNMSSSLESNQKLLIDQQSVIASLIGAKEDNKKYGKQLEEKCKKISLIEQELENLSRILGEEQRRHEDELKGFELKMETEIRDVKNEAAVRMGALNQEKQRILSEKDEQINAIRMDYEEQLQMAHAQLVRISEEKRALQEKNNNIIAYFKERIEEIERRAPPTDPINRKSSEKNGLNSAKKRSSIEASIETKSAGNFKMTGKNDTTYSPLPVQISDCSMGSVDKSASKPLKRKLFNKNVDFIED